MKKNKIKAWIVVSAAALHLLPAQTHLDLRTQTKSADLSSIGATKPAQTGSTLPSTCGVGELFFLIGAPAGTNLNLCAAANQWTASVGGSGGDTLGLQANSASAGAAATLNLLPGTYVTQSVICAGGTCSYQPDVDTTKLPTNAAIQAGQLVAVTTTSSSPTVYTGVMSSNDPIAAYAANQQLIWNVGPTACTGGAMTLNIDGLGAIPLKQGDGTTSMTVAQCGANAQLALTYDAVNAVFRGPLAGGSGGGGGVTGVTATSPLTSSGGATPNISATYQGNGSKVQLSTGTATTNDCVKFDANGNTIDAGAACGSGGGGGGRSRHFTAGTIFGQSTQLSAEWDANTYCCANGSFYSSASTLTGWQIPYNGTGGSPNWVQLRTVVPQGWAGSVSLSAFWSLALQNSGLGTGTHTYQVACLTPGVADFGVAPAMSTAATVTFNFTGTNYKTGQVDTPALNLPACLAGDTMLIRMTRQIGGTSIDSTVLNYFDLALQ